MEDSEGSGGEALLEPEERTRAGHVRLRPGDRTPGDPAPAPAGARARTLARPGTELLALLLLCLHAVLVVADGRASGLTVDESNYFNSGRILVEHGWVHEATVLQGPIPLYANQVFVPDFPAGGYERRRTPDEFLRRGRLGTLPFALLSAALVFVWSRRLFGAPGGLLSLLLHALNPLLIGFGGLILVDAHHAALVLATLFAAWRWIESRSLLWLACTGIALGATLATKYLGLFLIPVVAAAVLAGSAARGRGWAARARTGLLALGLVAACVLLTMHVAYRFEEGPGSFQGGQGSSELMTRVLGTPVLAQLAQLFPAPFLRGLDFQLFMGQHPWPTFLNGVTAPAHVDFYLASILCKTPEVVLLLALLVLVLRLPRLLCADCPPGWRSAAALTLAYAVLSVGYLSLFTEMQLGIRYILPIYPLLCLWPGSLLERARFASARCAALLLVVGALLAVDLRRNWPDLISYYNATCGGQARAHERFRNTNSDFGQYLLTGAVRLRERFPDLQLIGPGSGARFGRVALSCGSLRPSTPRWITLRPSVFHLGASWWVFEVTPEALERALESRDDPDLRRDLCVAYLGAGRRAEALRHLVQLDPGRADPLRAALAAEDAALADPSLASLESLIEAWSVLGRFDLAEREVCSHPERLRSSRKAALARLAASAERGDDHGVLEVFRAYPFAAENPIRLRLIDSLRNLGLHAEAQREFEALRPHLVGQGGEPEKCFNLAVELDMNRRLHELLR